jgi:hypothetical protein
MPAEPGVEEPGENVLREKTTVFKTAPLHSSTTRNQENIWPLRSRFWSQASTCQT